MVLDFEKLANATSGEAIVEPRKVFSTLLSDARFKFLHDVQATVLDQWFGRRSEKDLIIKMNTGSGKTLVALLALQSSLNEGVGPAVYVVPDNFLVGQVMEEAKALGISAVKTEKSANFVASKCILVINVHKLFNGRSVFGVRDEGKRIPIGTIVIDDAHACLGTVRDQFSLKISSSHKAYAPIMALFRSELERQSVTTLLDVEAEEPNAAMLVPFWAWQDQISKVATILQEYRESKELTFNWPLIGEALEFSRCAVGGGKIEISPTCLPIDFIPSFDQSTRRIYTTATLADDSVLLTELDANPISLSSPISPKSAGDFGPIETFEGGYFPTQRKIPC